MGLIAFLLALNSNSSDSGEPLPEGNYGYYDDDTIGQYDDGTYGEYDS